MIVIGGRRPKNARNPRKPREAAEEKPSVEFDESGLPDLFRAKLLEKIEVDRDFARLEGRKKELSKQLCEFLEAVDITKVHVDGVGKVARIRGCNVTVDREKLVKLAGVKITELCTRRTEYWYAQAYPEGGGEE